jgi:hypothetical protein
MLAALPGPALAEVCSAQRPDWDGTPVSALDEALWLMASPITVILIVATLLALRFRSQWGGVAIVVLWTGLVSVLTMLDPTGTRAPGLAEGCIGSPTLFIAAVTAICIATILYTAPSSRGA